MQTRVIIQGEPVSSNLAQTLADILTAGPIEDDDQLAEYATGAYSELPGFTYEGQFFREYRMDEDQDGGYTRYTYLPHLWSRRKVERVLDEHNWPLAGERCHHSYDCCGGLYCDGVKLTMTEKGIKVEQSVWRNV